VAELIVPELLIFFYKLTVLELRIESEISGKVCLF